MKRSIGLISIALLAAACASSGAGEAVVQPAAEASFAAIQRCVAGVAGAGIVLLIIFILVSAVRAQ